MAEQTDSDDVFELKNRFFGIGAVDDPHPRLAEMQAECPVHAGSISGRFGIVGPDNFFYPDDDQVIVFGFDTIERTFRDPQTFSSSYVVPAVRDTIGRTILEMDPPEHKRYRMLLQGAFTKKEMDRWEREFVRDIVSRTLDPLVPLGRGDLAADFAFHYPITVTAVAAGLPVHDVPAFYEQAALLTNVAVPAEDRLRASAELEAIVRQVIEERRRAPRADLVGILAEARIADPEGGEPVSLTDEEIVDFMRLLVPAGAQTTYRTLTNLLYGLLTHPDQYAAIVADLSLIPQAVEEGLRWEPPLLSFGRLVTADTEIEGHPVPEGSVVNLCVSEGNRDPNRWDRPAEFDIFREQKAHLAFGQGNHICLGIHFARMELRVALELIVERLPGLRLDPDADDVKVEGLMSRAAIRLPCLWDPVQAGGTTGVSG